MKFRKLLAATAVAAMVAGCGGGGSGSGVEYVAYDAPAISASQKKEFLDAVNEARAVGRECGKYGFMPAAPALKWDDRLYRAAYEHSEDMATTSHYAHTGSGKDSDWTAQVLELGRGSNPDERLKNNGSAYGWWGENIDSTPKTTNEVMERWLNSEGHCHNIMKAEYKYLGMALVESIDQWGTYWTQEFGGE